MNTTHLKKSWKQTLWKTINVVSSVTLIINMTMVGVFIAPKAASAADTGYLNPSSNSSIAGLVSGASNAYTENSVDATFGYTDQQKYGTFNIPSLPSGQAVVGIELKVRAHCTYNCGSDKDVTVYISDDGPVASKLLKYASSPSLFVFFGRRRLLVYVQRYI